MSVWRRKPDGRPYADLRDIGLGKRSLLNPAVIREHGPTPADDVCQRLFDELMAQLTPTLGAKPQKDAIADMVRWYCKVYHISTTESSARNRGVALGRLEAWCKENGVTRPEDFGTVHAQEFVKALVESKLAPGSVKLYLCHVKALFRAAVASGILAEMPVKKWPTVRAPRPEINPYTPAQVADILEDLQAHRPKDAYPLALFLAVTGWRVSDALALRTSDIDKGVASRRARKTGAAIRQKLNVLALEAIAMARPKDGRVFGAITQMAFHHVLLSASKRLGFRAHAHGFRHSLAVEMAKGGVPIAVIADVLGHADPTTTLKSYQHFLPSASDGAVSDYGEKIRGAMEKCHPNVTPMRKSQ